jgi:hypothetical protein
MNKSVIVKADGSGGLDKPAADEKCELLVTGVIKHGQWGCSKTTGE